MLYIMNGLNFKKKFLIIRRRQNFQKIKMFLNLFFQNFTPKNLVKNCNDSCKNISPSESNWIPSIPYNLFFDLIKENSYKKSQKIAEIFDNIGDTDWIFYVGGYLSNRVLINFLEREFPQFRHLIPLRPIIEKLKGAVLFRTDPNIITLKKVKYIIGLSNRENWDEIKYKEGEKI